MDTSSLSNVALSKSTEPRFGNKIKHEQQTGLTFGSDTFSKTSNVTFQGNVNVVKRKGKITDEQVNELKEYLMNRYNELVKELDLKHPPEIKFNKHQHILTRLTGLKESNAGYSFLKNLINVYYDFSDMYKITVDSTTAPFYGDIKNLSKFAAMMNEKANTVIEPITLDEAKKFYELALVHELRHAKQYDLMRRTEGIGIQGIINAEKTGNANAKLGSFLDKFGEATNSYAFWFKLKDDENQIKKDSEEGKLAYKFREALENTDSIAIVKSNGGDAYQSNGLEQDAFEFSEKYMADKYGKEYWN